MTAATPATTTPARPPHTIRMHVRDNVAIVANDGGLPAGTVLPSGLVLRDKVPQGHKVALVDLPADGPVLRYGIPIGYAMQAIPAGSWVHERLLHMPDARGLENLPIATVQAGRWAMNSLRRVRVKVLLITRCPRSSTPYT